MCSCNSGRQARTQTVEELRQDLSQYQPPTGVQYPVSVSADAYANVPQPQPVVAEATTAP